jgi:hypothetical protein
LNHVTTGWLNSRISIPRVTVKLRIKIAGFLLYHIARNPFSLHLVKMLLSIKMSGSKFFLIITGGESIPTWIALIRCGITTYQRPRSFFKDNKAKPYDARLIWELGLKP